MKLKKILLRFAIIVPILVLLFFLSKNIIANWSVWDTPEVYYDFEGSTGSVSIKDRAGTNDLTLTTTSGTVTGIRVGGKIGRKAEFNGTTDYGAAADSAVFSQTSSFSVEAWVKFDTISATANTIQTVLAKWDETTDIRAYRLIIQTDSTGRAYPKFQISTLGTAASIQTVTGKTQIIAGQWYLLTGYFKATSPGTLYIYVSGVRDGTTSSVGTSLTDTSAKFYLGTTKTGASTYTNFLDGSIDEVRLFSGTRTEGALAYSMERGKPVIDMKFDDGSGFQAIDSSPETNRGALINFPTDNSQWVAGQNNTYALQFAGTDDYVDLGNKPKLQLGGAITISAWINPTDLSANYAIVGQPDNAGYAFKITTGGEMTFGETDGTPIATSSGAGITAGTWQYVTVSYDGTNAAFYKDGRLITSAAVAFASPPSAGAVFVGRASSEYFKGKIDGLVIYPYNRTLFEVYVDINQGMLSFGAPGSLQPNNAQIACPQGFVHVPGDPLYGTSDFCVMKYEAKCAATSDPSTGLTSPDTGYHTYSNSTTACTSSNSKMVVSVASGYPIANISQTNAITYCSNLGSNYHLMTNEEWMTIARNAERLGANWYGSAPGTNFMFSGHNDNGPANVALVASTDDNAGYTGTGDSASACDGIFVNYVAGDDTTSGRACVGQRRTHYLSNGEVAWDFGGNVWEWVNDTIVCAATVCTVDEMPYGSSAAEEWVEYASGAAGWGGDVLATNGSLTYDDMRPSNSAWNSDGSVGRLYTDANDPYPSGAYIHAFLRGGTWGHGAYAGLFTLGLHTAPSGTGSDIGFRCAASL